MNNVTRRLLERRLDAPAVIPSPEDLVDMHRASLAGYLAVRNHNPNDVKLLTDSAAELLYDASTSGPLDESTIDYFIRQSIIESRITEMHILGEAGISAGAD